MKNICFPVMSFKTLGCPLPINEFSHLKFSPLKLSIMVLAVMTIFMTFIPYLVFAFLKSPTEESNIPYKVNMPLKDFFSIVISIPVSEIYKIFKNTMNAGVNEELFCRFFLLRIVFYESLGLNLHLSILLSSIIFGIIHIGNQIEPGNFRRPYKTIAGPGGQLIFHQIIYATFIGIILGYFYVMTNNLVLVMFIHFLFDFIVDITAYIQTKYIQTNVASS